MENTELEKVIVAISGASGEGKSSTIRHIATLILNLKPEILEQKNLEAIQNKKGDIVLVVKINNVVIGLISQGDPKSGLKDRLRKIIDNFECDLIICACRTKGETTDAVKSFMNKYDVIWASTYRTRKSGLHKSLDELKAVQVLQLIQLMGFIH